MRIRWITVGLAAASAASFLFSSMSPHMWEVVHLNALAAITPRNCRRCADTLIGIGLLLEALALAIHARKQEKPIASMVVATLFGSAGALVLTAIIISLHEVEEA